MSLCRVSSGGGPDKPRRSRTFLRAALSGPPPSPVGGHVVGGAKQRKEEGEGGAQVYVGGLECQIPAIV